MCMFAGEVRSVSKTRIFVGTNGHSGRFTAYQMAVELMGSNAMILPVPTSQAVWLVDMSGCEDFFDQLAKLFPTDAVKSLSLGMRSMSRSFLEVHRVGSYDVSVASNWQDIDRVDPSVFTLSDQTAETLRTHYPQGYSFVVCKLTSGGTIHPLGYYYETNQLDELFVPTRHEHGEHGDPVWDHEVYVQGGEMLIATPKLGSSWPRCSDWQGGEHQAIIGRLVAKVPKLGPFINARRQVLRHEWKGPMRQNLDVRFAA